jgi:Eco57I restriction-modification methylase
VSDFLTSVRVAGGLLPPDVLSAVLSGSLDGLKTSDYHLAGESPREAAARVWTHLLGVYRRFRDDLVRLPENDPAVGLTRERWLSVLLRELGYGRVPLTGPGGLTVGDRQYPVSHLWGSTPIHLLGWGVELDKRTPGIPGAAHRAPHAMVQEMLNRTDVYLWAIVSNGRLLRLLRDSTTLTGQAYVEFDLEAMFDGELFAEFALLFLLCHQSRVEFPDGGQPADCWLERWRTTAVSQGVRALNLLRDGVERALQTLGTGFLQHPANSRLRDDLATGVIQLDDVHQSLLRTVYRLLFWSVAEARDVLVTPTAPADVRKRYRDHFSAARLRGLAVRRHGSAHSDLWDAARLVLTALGRPEGEPRLGLPGLGGLFNESAADVLTGLRLGNQPLLSAIRSLSVVQPKGQPRRLIDFRHLGAEELGSIYESLLELVPRHDPTAHTYTVETLAGHDRKTTGSYYTPADLVELVLDTALDPVLDDAETQPDPEQALLAVTVCDPAIGSGHFMVAAARRIAQRLAVVRTGEIDPTPSDTQAAMHDVVARCIYGVDLNPMAADLAKVSLWMESMTPGKPLSFLDHHIKVGNALLGTTPGLIAGGIPDSAYKPLAGDDKKVANAWRQQNHHERNLQTTLFSESAILTSNFTLRDVSNTVSTLSSRAQSLRDVTLARSRYAQGRYSAQAIRLRRTADTWCAAFLVNKAFDSEPITQATLEQVGAGTESQHARSLVDSLAFQHKLFHWHLEFPEVFQVTDEEAGPSASGWTGGFSAVLGNPPWETLQMSEKEFFASRDANIAGARTAALRKQAIAALAESNSELLDEFRFESRRGSAESHLIRASGRYPLCAVGKINTYSIFAELFRSLVAPAGRTGIITPTGLATDATTAPFFADTLRHHRLATFLDFDNEGRIFPGVHHTTRFAISAMTGGKEIKDVRLSFFNRSIVGATTRAFELAADEILQLNPNTGNLPVFHSRLDAEIALSCHKNHPVLVRTGSHHGNPWGLKLSQGLFNMATDSAHFMTGEDLRGAGAHFDGWAWQAGEARWLPLYEAKLLSTWNHRFSTYAGATQAQLNVASLPRLAEKELNDPSIEPLARYWVSEKLVDEVAPWDEGWFLGFRRLTFASNYRTLIPFAFPRAAVGDNAWVISNVHTNVECLLAVLSSFVADYLVRQKLTGTTLSGYIVEQLAVPKPAFFDERPNWLDEELSAFIRPRVLELTYTSHKVAEFASATLNSDPGAPFRWDRERRDELAAEVDAAIMHAYELCRDAVERVLDSFPVVRRYDERDHGEFRTRRLILAAYDSMAAAARTGVPFISPLNPPAGQGPRHKEQM